MMAAAGSGPGGRDPGGGTWPAEASRPAGPPAARPVSRLAIAALICAIAQLAFWFLAAIAAVILGHKARRQIRRTGEGGDGIAVASLILGYIGLGLTLLVAASVIGFLIAWHHRSTQFPQVPPMLGNPG